MDIHKNIEGAVRRAFKLPPEDNEATIINNFKRQKEQEEKITQLALKMIEEEHELFKILAQKLNSPNWIKDTLEKAGKEIKEHAWEENKKLAIAILSEKARCNPLVGEKIFELLQQEQQPQH